MLEFRNLKNNLKKDYSTFPWKRVAILGDSPTQLLSIGLRGQGYESKMNYEIYEADFNQVEYEILNNESKLYQFKPDYVIIYYSSENLFLKYCQTIHEQKLNFADNFIIKINQLIDHVSIHSDAYIIWVNFCGFQDGVFGNFANKTSHSFLYQIRKLNLELMIMAQSASKLFICDFDILQSTYGINMRRKESTFINTGIITDINFVPYLTTQINKIILAIQGKFKKCLILDLDNTLWGGIIGDDGIENIQIGELGIGKAFNNFQWWIKLLKERGIILVVCSKNNEEVARLPFNSHPEMVLRLSDLSLFVANWNNKADNIRHIQSILNIGFDSMVFIDDNPFERNLVRIELPEITVPELPNDPSEYLKYIQNLNLFETNTFNNEDINRTRNYQDESRRLELKKSFTNEDAYLKGLIMVMDVKPFNNFNIPRVAQLTQRSNQFNLRTIRYNDYELNEMILNPEYITLSFNLKDMYGDYGLISIVVMKKDHDQLFIVNWVMSCRVLNRGIEKFVLNKLIELAKEKKILKITGEYLKTEKNNIVQNHYNNLGFNFVEENVWEINVLNYKLLDNHIKENYG